MKSRQRSAFRIRDGVLEVGLDASPDAIATLACRRMLHDDGEREERAVQLFVESLGFAYVPTREARKTSGVALRAVS